MKKVVEIIKHIHKISICGVPQIEQREVRKNNTYFSNHIYCGQMQNGVVCNCRGFSNINNIIYIFFYHVSYTTVQVLQVSCSDCKFWNITMVLTTNACWTGRALLPAQSPTLALLQKTGSYCLHWHTICKKQHPRVPSWRCRGWTLIKQHVGLVKDPLDPEGPATLPGFLTDAGTFPRQKICFLAGTHSELNIKCT